MTADVYGSVAYQMGIAVPTDALAQPHPNIFHDADMSQLNMVLSARGAALAQTIAESGFKCFDDSDGYNDIFPSVNYLFTL